MASLHFIPPDLQKCTVSMNGGEEGVMYETFAGQSVDFILIIRDEKGSKEAEGGHQVKAQFIQNVNQEMLMVQDSGEGSYCFSCHPREGGGLVTLSVMVEGQSIRGSPFSWNVLPFSPVQRVKHNFAQELLTWKLPYALGWRGRQYCWKLQLVNSFSAAASELQIGVINWKPSGMMSPGKWFWHYKAANEVKDFLRSDHQKTSIISVQDKDVFTVFLNLNTKKLIIYNARSKQAEIFTKVTGENLSPFIVPCDLVKIISFFHGQ